VGRELHIKVDDKIDASDLREMIGLFHRYQIDKRQLAQFVSAENVTWFRDDKGAYWHQDVFGTL
jgi:hypothetical protein